MDDKLRNGSVKSPDRMFGRMKFVVVFGAGAVALIALIALVVVAGAERDEPEENARIAAGGEESDVAPLARSPKIRQLRARIPDKPEGAVLARPGEFPVPDDMPALAESLGLVPEERPAGPLALVSAGRMAGETEDEFRNRSALRDLVERLINEGNFDSEQQQELFGALYDMHQNFKVALAESMRGDLPEEGPHPLEAFADQAEEEFYREMSEVLSREQMRLVRTYIAMPGGFGSAELVQPD